MEIEKEILERIMQESQEKYKSLFEDAPYAIILFDSTGKILECNSTATKLFKFERTDLIGRNYLELNLYPKDLIAVLKTRLRLFTQGEETEPIELQISRSDGSKQWIRSKISRVKIGNREYYQTIIQNITKEKEIEAKLRDYEMRYNAMFNRSIYCLYIHDFEGRFLDANAAALKLLGYEKEEFTALHFTDLVEGDYLTKAFHLLEQLKKDGIEPPPSLFKLKRKDGKIVWVEVQVTLLYKDGKPYAVQGIARDLTDKVLAENLLKKSQKNLQTLYNSINDFIFVLDEEGHILHFNFVVPTHLGYAQDELLGQHIASIHPPNRKQEVLDTLSKFKKGELDRCSIPLLTRDNTLIPVETRLSRGYWNYSKVIICIARDITDRIKVEKQVTLRTGAMDSAVSGISMADLNGTLTYVNKALVKMWGYDDEKEMIGKNVTNFWKDREIAEKITTGLINRKIWQGEGKGKRKDGTLFDVFVLTSIIEDKNGDPIGMMGSFIDITEQKQKELELKESEAKFSYLFHHSNDGIFLHDLEGNIIDVNQKVLEQFGYSREEMLSLTIPNLHTTEDFQRLRSAREKLLQDGFVTFEVNYLKKNGESFPAEVSSNMVNLGKKSIIQSIVRDISERKQAEAMLKESESRYRTLFERSPTSIILLDKKGNFLDCNEATEQIFKIPRSDLIGKTFKDLLAIPNEEREKLQIFHQDLKNGREIGPIDFKIILKDSTQRWISIRNALMKFSEEIIGYQLLVEDITEEKLAKEKLKNYAETLEEEVEIKTKQLQLERDELQRTLKNLKNTQEQLIQSEKLASIGLLAAGIAHEINNPLMGIINYAQIIQEELKGQGFVNMEKKPFSFLKGIIREGKRISGIVTDLLTFSRERPRQYQFSDIADIVKSALSLLFSAISTSQISLELKLDKRLPKIPMDPQKIQQVLINVLQNAIAALDEKFGKKVIKGTKKITIESSRVIQNGIEYGKLIIRDNGQGIKAKNLPKVFDPFFTTKDISQEYGTGLGLSISYGIIKDHKGKIEIQSAWQEGTEVTIFLPLKAANYPISKNWDEV
ncbi:MAG: PAS domain S-box protein [Candidatus Helarchaeota archaeon]